MNGIKRINDDSKGEDEESFCDKIWQECLKQNLPQSALKTKFIEVYLIFNLFYFIQTHTQIQRRLTVVLKMKYTGNTKW